MALASRYVRVFAIRVSIFLFLGALLLTTTYLSGPLLPLPSDLTPTALPFTILVHVLAMSLIVVVVWLVLSHEDSFSPGDALTFKEPLDKELLPLKHVSPPLAEPCVLGQSTLQDPRHPAATGLAPATITHEGEWCLGREQAPQDLAFPPPGELLGCLQSHELVRQETGEQREEDARGDKAKVIPVALPNEPQTHLEADRAGSLVHTQRIVEIPNYRHKKSARDPPVLHERRREMASSGTPQFKAERDATPVMTNFPLTPPPPEYLRYLQQRYQSGMLFQRSRGLVRPAIGRTLANMEDVAKDSSGLNLASAEPSHPGSFVDKVNEETKQEAAVKSSFTEVDKIATETGPNGQMRPLLKSSPSVRALYSNPISRHSPKHLPNSDALSGPHSILASDSTSISPKVSFSSVRLPCDVSDFGLSRIGDKGLDLSAVSMPASMTLLDTTNVVLTVNDESRLKTSEPEKSCERWPSSASSAADKCKLLKDGLGRAEPESNILNGQDGLRSSHMLDYTGARFLRAMKKSATEDGLGGAEGLTASEIYPTTSTSFANRTSASIPPTPEISPRPFATFTILLYPLERSRAREYIPAEHKGIPLLRRFASGLERALNLP
ncbi:hypothetical protein FRB90_012415 [Tulasnella sp. 427]|nr:hypothetical protein FRB90_012415 [Tulasnella sp. 427]